MLGYYPYQQLGGQLAWRLELGGRQAGTARFIYRGPKGTRLYGIAATTGQPIAYVSLPTGSSGAPEVYDVDCNLIRRGDPAPLPTPEKPKAAASVGEPQPSRHKGRGAAVVVLGLLTTRFIVALASGGGR